MLCVEFPQVQNIDLTELIHVLKAVAIVTSRLPITRTSRQLEQKLICPEFPVQICLSFAPRSIYFLLPLK